MARPKFGGGSADYLVDPATGLPVANFTVQVWTAEVGGAHETDLLDASGIAAVAVTSDSFGGFRFYGKDGYKGAYWLEGAGGTRYLVNPVDLADRIAALEVADFAQQIQDAIETAVASALDDAQQMMEQHTNGDPDPHPQYPTMKGTLAGADIFGSVSSLGVPGVDIVDGDLEIIGA